ncbi:MAG: sirohydrochlorin chelatase [Streptosporangiales bacterium]|nr:sirohydrochlorin chelatase [Streptosporangiales bacterium]
MRYSSVNRGPVNRGPSGRGPVPLVAVAHGSRDPRAARTVEALLDLVRARRPGLAAVAAYLDHAAPTPGQALATLAERGHRSAVVLPLLLTAAYHSGTDLPAALTEVRARHPRLELAYGATLGPDDLLIDALDRRLTEAGVDRTDRGTSVVLAAAGSTDPSAGAVVAGMARRWRRRTLRDVRVAYASAASPKPGEAVARLLAEGAPRVAVATYLLWPGLFAEAVREASVQAGAAVVAPVLGAAPELAELVLRRYDEAAATAAVPLAG